MHSAIGYLPTTSVRCSPPLCTTGGCVSRSVPALCGASPRSPGAFLFLHPALAAVVDLWYRLDRRAASSLPPCPHPHSLISIRSWLKPTTRHLADPSTVSVSTGLTVYDHLTVVTCLARFRSTHTWSPRPRTDTLVSRSLWTFPVGPSLARHFRFGTHRSSRLNSTTLFHCIDLHRFSLLVLWIHLDRLHHCIANMPSLRRPRRTHRSASSIPPIRCPPAYLLFLRVPSQVSSISFLLFILARVDQDHTALPQDSPRIRSFRRPRTPSLTRSLRYRYVSLRAGCPLFTYPLIDLSGIPPRASPRFPSLLFLHRLLFQCVSRLWCVASLLPDLLRRLGVAA